LATSLAVGATAWALTRRRRAGLVAALLYLAGYPVWNWGALQRVDAFAVALEWVAIALFAVAWAVPLRPAWALWATAPLLLGAVYARQTVVAGAFAVFGTALVLRPRLGLAALAAYAGAGLALFAILERVTGGQFRRHIVDGNLNDWAWARVDFYWQPFWALLHWAVPLGAVALVLGLVTRRSQLPLLYALGAAATALTIGKIGSNVNYLLPLWAALSLLGGLAAGYAAGLPRWPGALTGAVVAGWLLVGLQQAYHVPYEPPGPQPEAPPGAGKGVPAAVLDAVRFPQLPLWRLDPWGAPPALLLARARERYAPLPTAAAAADAARAAAHLDASAGRGDLLGEEMSFTVTSGRRIYLQPFEFSQLALQGVWDQGPLLADVRRGHFRAVVLRFRLEEDPSWRGERINPALLGALREHYELDAEFGDYFIYRYRGIP
ncbi:MAG TPA: hypothetical protein VHQ00_00205, partial [Chloroflexota bacterium]|nr:hypothetical protein [Chloroflexota bacterium]